MIDKVSLIRYSNKTFGFLNVVLTPMVVICFLILRYSGENNNYDNILTIHETLCGHSQNLNYFSSQLGRGTVYMVSKLLSSSKECDMLYEYIISRANKIDENFININATAIFYSESFEEFRNYYNNHVINQGLELQLLKRDEEYDDKKQKCYHKYIVMLQLSCDLSDHFNKTLSDLRKCYQFDKLLTETQYNHLITLENKLLSIDDQMKRIRENFREIGSEFITIRNAVLNS